MLLLTCKIEEKIVYQQERKVSMERDRRFKTIGLVAVLVAVIGLSVAFAALSQLLTINGTGKVSASNWSVVWEEIDTETLVLSDGVTKETGYPKLGTTSLVLNDSNLVTGDTLNLGTITLHKPGDKATFKINIANKGDIDAKVTGVTGVSVNNTYVSYSVKYLDNEEVSNALSGRLLAAGDRKLVTIEVKFKEDVTTEQYNQIPQEGVTVNLNGVTITYTQNDGTGVADTTTTTTQAQQVQLYDVSVNDLTNFGADSYNISEVYALIFVDQNDVVHAFFLVPPLTAGNEEAYLQYSPDLSNQNGTFYVYDEDLDKWKLIENYEGTLTEIDTNEIIIRNVRMGTSEEYALAGFTPFTSQMISDIFTITEASN